MASPQTHGALVKASERIALVTDGIVRGLGERDARGAAKQLADVADDVVMGEGLEARETQEAEHDRGKARGRCRARSPRRGSKSMKNLGELGRDLGEIVHVDDARIARARSASDWPHAELAARDLVARFREPDPSFGEQGGPQKAGGESGGGRGTPGASEDEDGDDVGRAFEEAAQDLDQLSQDHAGEMAKVQNDLSGAESPDDAKSLADESKKHAEKVRESVRDLPSLGGASESWSGKAAAAREQAEQMARALEEGSPSDAISSGKSALQTLDEAKRASQREPWRRSNNLDIQPPIDRQLDESRRKLEPEIAWAEQKLAELRKKAAERARGNLGEDAVKEHEMAERARQLGEKGRAEMPGRERSRRSRRPRSRCRRPPTSSARATRTARWATSRKRSGSSRWRARPWGTTKTKGTTRATPKRTTTTGVSPARRPTFPTPTPTRGPRTSDVV